MVNLASFIYDKRRRRLVSSHASYPINGCLKSLLSRKDILQAFSSSKCIQKLVQYRNREYLFCTYPHTKNKNKGYVIPISLELKERMKQFQFLEQIQDILIMVDRHGKILYTNKVFEEITRHTPSQLVNRSVVRILNLKKELNISAMKQILKHGKTKTVKIGKGDRRRVFELNVFPLSEHKTQGFIFWGRNITEHEKYQDELKKKLSSLISVTQKISSHGGSAHFLHDIITKSCLMCRAPVGILRLVNNDNKLELYAVKNLSRSYSHLAKYIDFGEGSAGIAASRKIPYGISDVRKSKNVKFKNALLDEGVISIISVPIIFQEEVMGTIGLGYRFPYRNTKQEILFLLSFASQIAISLHTIKQEQLINESYFNTLNALILTVEARDPYTRGHSDRVTRFAVSIARKMGIKQDKITYLKFGTLVHDIGKIAISDTILLKPGKLTLTEWVQIQLHPVKGAEMLFPLRFIESALPVVKYHHERFDGKGYPDGYKKDRIPILARIVSVADAFDAMTSDRPYRKRFSMDRALGEITRNRCSQFDPEVVDAFLSIF